MLTFRRTYFWLTILLFVVEICIAAFLHDKFIRPYVGDFLVVILLYCFARSFFRISKKLTALLVLLFAYLIEVLQYFALADKLHLSKGGAARVILGSAFEWQDMLAYTLGTVAVLLLDKTKD